MKNAYMWVIVFVLIAGGAWFFIGPGNKAEAPISDTETGDTGVVSNTMPVLGPEGEGVQEMVVVNPAPVKEFTISGKNFSFTPSAITVKKGERVKITFQNTAGFHDFKIDEYGVAAKQAQAPATEILEFTADKAGTFEYYCSVGSHRAMGMKGTLTVTE